LQGAARAAELRRETPVLTRLADGRLVEGIVDLAYRDENAGWTVVDFKTDREFGERRQAYAHQVRIYAEAIESATGNPAHGLLLIV
jgi:ATP-dependent exoDNAse (exonuclease V) beta subunit